MRTTIWPGVVSYGLGVVMLTGALLFGYQARQAPTAPEPVDLDVFQTFAPVAPLLPAVAAGAGFDVNIVDAIDLLAGLAPDDRAEQLADWAAYGVIARQGADAEAVSNWAVSHPPYRTGGYESAASYTYGPGRSFSAGDGTVWLIYEEGQPRVRTLAQQADKLRAQTGDIPSRYAVFRYNVDLPRAAIRVEREADVLADEMFSETFGYVSGQVSQKADLVAFLAQVQDLTYIDGSPGATATDRGIVLGGRRFADEPLASVGLDDVAVLYKAHTQIARDFETLDREFNRKLDAVSAVDEAIAAEGSLVVWIDSINRRRDTVQARRDFASKASALWSALTSAGMQVPEPPVLLNDKFGANPLQRTVPDLFTMPDPGSTGTLLPSRQALTDIVRRLTGGGADRPDVPSPDFQLPPGIDEEVLRRFRDKQGIGSGGVLGQPGAGRQTGATEVDALESARRWLEGLRQQVLSTQSEEIVERLRAEFQAGVIAAGRWPPAEPGFSLDPQWELPGILDDLRAARESSAGFVYDAVEEMGGDTGTETAPRLVSSTLDPIRIGRFELGLFSADPSVVETELTRLIDQLEGAEKTGAAADDAQLIAFYEAKDNFQKKSMLGPEYAVLSFVLDVAEVRNRVQCARYDGALLGTSVGMNLFYTDVLAKLWAGLDFGAHAPVLEIPGFRHLPGTHSKLEGIYEDEQRRLSGTRLWFGHKASSLRHDSRGKLLFQPVATRIYAAGNNQLLPGQESEASEASLRVFTWWDRHFQDVADYEPAFHRQNQIMKWSIVTGMLAEEGLLSWLEGETVDTSQRFDLWYPAQADLKFRDDIHLLPPEQWIGAKKTECMEILVSYEFRNLQGGMFTYEGGVSLGSKRAITQENRLASGMPRNLGDAMPDAAAAAAGRYTSFEGAQIAVSTRADGSVRTALTPKVGNGMRSGGLVSAPRPLYLDVLKSERGGFSVGMTLKDKPVAALRTLLPNADTVTLAVEAGKGLRGQDEVRRIAMQIDDLSGSFLKQDPADYVIDIAHLPEFRPSEGAAIFASPGGAMRIFRLAANNAPRAPPAYQINVTKLAEAGTDLLAEAVRTQSDGTLSIDGVFSRFAVTLDTSPLPKSALDAVGASRYQLIEMAEDGSRGGLRVARVFYQDVPPTFSGTQTVRIATGIPELPEIEALHSGNAILIDQSVLTSKGVEQQRVLLDLARRIEQAPKDFLDQIRAGAARLAPQPLPRIELSEKAVDAVRKAGRNGDVSAIGAFLTEARDGGYLDVAVKDVRAAVAADVVSETRLGESSGFLGAAARNPAIAGEADVALARNIAAFKSSPDNAEALGAARRIAEGTPEALASGGGRGGDGGIIDRVLAGSFDGPPGGGFDVEPNGFRPLVLFKAPKKPSTGGVSRKTQARLAWRLDRSDLDTLILIDKTLMDEAAGHGSDQMHAFVGLSGPVPENHAGSALKALDPADVRLIIADDSSPLRRADGIREADGDVQLTLWLKGNGMPQPPPPGGELVALDDPLLDPSGDEDGLMIVVLADCDLDGDGDIPAAENQDCVEDALVYDAETGEFRRLGANGAL